MTTENDVADVTVYIKPVHGEGIPFDVLGTLTGVISLAYPGAKMGPGEAGQGLSLIVPADARTAKRPGKRAIAAKVERADEDNPRNGVIGLQEDGTVSLTSEECATVLVEYGYGLLMATDAVNYVEQTAITPDGKRLELTVRWGQGATPHAMRQKAERERDEARAALERVEARVAEWEVDRDSCLTWLADPAMHVDENHPTRLSDKADMLNRRAVEIRAALAGPVSKDAPEP